MKLRLLSIAAALLAASTFTTAHAQVGIYGKFDGVHVSNSATDNIVAKGWFVGGGGGLYFNFLHLGPLALGADARGDFSSQSPHNYRDVLFGVRVAAKAPVIPLRPYAQFSVGLGGPSYSGVGGGINYNNKFQYWVIGGVDHTIFPHVDWRIAELGYGRMSTVSSTPGPSINLFSASTGIVVRFP